MTTTPLEFVRLAVLSNRYDLDIQTDNVIDELENKNRILECTILFVIL